MGFSERTQVFIVSSYYKRLAETFGEDVWYYLQEHDYPYTLDEGVHWFPESW